MSEDVLSNAVYALILGAWLTYLGPMVWRRFASDPHAVDRAALRYSTVIAVAIGAAVGGTVALASVWRGIAAGIAVCAFARIVIPRYARWQLADEKEARSS
ncbi:predicted protein [Streptomyces viridosporus ATCC 14672]|uniref:Predicted protein n=1 Tax=Streptomyces viridosporus (strain ATCC 14672 / DSM 40746 / JCM 4963 / KCTC 9882 / NRRL B-12104 / FH 1290) TaxID=566461 RepID=D6A9F2_STRV1|nr:hypothetical protein [Streptomyces viridosporus]EFE68188.1 predicted protein [Streptomyces viridosporus ATCC 14672]